MKLHRLTAILVAVVSMVAVACGTESAATRPDASTTAPASGDSSLAGLTGVLRGQGSSFQDTFQQQVASDFAAAAKNAGSDATVTYTKTGSSDGKKALADRTVDFAGSDSSLKPEEVTAFAGRKVLYFPIVGGPIAVAFKVDGVTRLNLSAATIAKIFQAEITTWNDPAIAAENDDLDLPSTPITVVHRSDGSGTTKNFTTFLDKAAPGTWRLGSGETVNWPAATQGAEKSTGVTQVIGSTDGAIGYADLADAAKERLTVAAVKGSGTSYVAPTPDAASIALGEAKIADNLTFDPLNSTADGAYPITSPTWMLVDASVTDPEVVRLTKAYLTYVLTTGQRDAKSLLYAPVPEQLAAKALAQLDHLAGA